MSNKLHNIDDSFHSAYQQFEDDPSPGVWEEINAGLDKKDAESYKRRFINWKRVAIFLAVLLAGFVLYDSGILQTGAGYSVKKIITRKTITPSADEKKKEAKDQNSSFRRNETKEPYFTDKEIANKKEDNKETAIAPDDNKNKNTDQKDIAAPKNVNAVGAKDQPANKIDSQKNISAGGNINMLAKNKRTRSKIVNNKLTDKSSELIQPKQLPEEKMNSAGIVTAKTNQPEIARAINTIVAPQLTNTRNSLLLKNNSNTSIKGISLFNAYWMLTGFVSYDRVNYKLDSDVPATINSIKHREVHEPSYSGGLLATRQFRKKWVLQTGLIYSNTAIGISPQKIYALQDPAGDIAYKYITSSGYAYIKPGFGAPPAFGDSLAATEAKHTLQFLTVPVVIKYAIGKNKLSFIPGAGIEANFLTSAKLITEIEDASNRETVFVNKLSGTKSFYWSMVADAELRYSLNKKFALSLRPVFRYAISPITENNVVETFPYSFGTGLGVAYKF